jgi:hypothetical protein
VSVMDQPGADRSEEVDRLTWEASEPEYEVVPAGEVWVPGTDYMRQWRTVHDARDLRGVAE